MAKMKKKQQNEKLYCPYCGGLAVLRPAEYVYGERNLNPDNYLYVCSGYPSCDSYIIVWRLCPWSGAKISWICGMDSFFGSLWNWVCGVYLLPGSYKIL